MENQAMVYAALILHDSGLPVTADNLRKTVSASGIDVRETLPILFARFLEKKSISDLMKAAASSGSSAPAAPVAGAAPAAKKEEKKKEKEPEPEEEDEGGLGGLFD